MGRLVAALAKLSPAEAGKLEMRPGAIVRIDVNGLPEAKESEARWWIKSGPRHKGLPFKKEEPAPAPPKAKAAPAKKPAPPAKKAAAPVKKPAPKKAAPRKPAPKAGQVLAPPRPPPAKPAPPSSAAQRFMGTPRPAPRPPP